MCWFLNFFFQRAVLEPAMQGRDMIGRARTGTGKTLAFGIPILDKIIQFNAKNGFVFSSYSIFFQLTLVFTEFFIWEGLDCCSLNFKIIIR